MRPELLELYREHRRSVFLTVSNGTLIDEATARRVAGSGNVLPMISIERDETHTDTRRGPGVHRKVLACMERLRRQGVLFGFSAVVARDNLDTLAGDRFVSEMVERGCSVGFYNDLIPLDEGDLPLLADPQQKRHFRTRLGELRRRFPILLVHLPEDEYDGTGRCQAVAGGGMHINARGFVEPCPFAHLAAENVRDGGFEKALRSPFLAAIRSHPGVLIHGEVGCSQVHNARTLADIAAQSGACPTRSSSRPFSMAAEALSQAGGGSRSGGSRSGGAAPAR